MAELTRQLVAEIEECKRRLSFLESQEQYVFGARAYRDSAQVMTSGVWAPLSFNVEVHDTDGMWAIANPTRFTAARAGYYIAGGGFEASAGLAGGAHVYITVVATSGAVLTELESGSGYWAAGLVPCLSVATGMFHMAVGDYVELYIWQESGGDLTIYKADATHPRKNHGWIMRAISA